MTDSTATEQVAGGYIRGGGGMLSVGRYAGRIVAGVVLAALAALTVAYAISGHHQNARLNRLRDHGVAVSVTVSGCRGVATGTGISGGTFSCHGGFALAGHHYDDLIGDNTAQLMPGSVVAGLVDPDSPTVLASATGLARAHPSNGAYSGAVVCGGGFLLVAIFALWWSRRGPRAEVPAEPAGPEPALPEPAVDQPVISEPVVSEPPVVAPASPRPSVPAPQPAVATHYRHYAMPVAVAVAAAVLVVAARRRHDN